jgi:cold-inducible RNA-binding protein
MKIFVGNLSYHTTEQELEQAFAPFGEITSVNIVIDRYSNRSRGFGFVEMPDQASAEAAIEKLHNSTLDDRSIVVNEAKPKPEGEKRFSKRY